ncbi:hypothetical protein LEP1GSC192_3813 [Leptospira sp. B5-022]|nr:hypothetical protein LEP1GSC192_3813 [Leptospira sp. B5-022]
MQFKTPRYEAQVRNNDFRAHFFVRKFSSGMRIPKELYKKRMY